MNWRSVAKQRTRPAWLVVVSPPLDAATVRGKENRMPKTRFLLAGLALAMSISPTFASATGRLPDPSDAGYRAAKLALERSAWAAEHPEACALLDDAKASQLMDGLLLKLAVLCDRPEFLGAVLQEENEGGFEALGTDVRANDPGTDSGASRTQSETSIAVNETTGTLCAGYNDSFHGVTQGLGYTGFSSSTDGGATWSDHGALGPTSFGDPSIFWRRTDGKFYIGAIHSSGMGLWDLGANCTSATFVANPHVGGGDDKELFAVDNNPASPFYGRMYMAWTDFSAGARIFEVHSDNGTSWSAPVALSGAGVDVQGAWPAVAPNGSDVYVAWVRWNPYSTGPIDIEVSRSTNGGGSWALVTNPMTGQVNPRASGPTSSCGRPALNGNIRYLPSPEIAVGPDGALHVVYTYDPDGFNTGDVVNAYYRRSTNNGTSWGTEVPLNTVGTNDQFFPSLSVGANNIVSASWYDRRLDGGNLRVRYFQRSSFDGGVSFGTDMEVTDADSPVVLDPNLATCYHGDYDTQIQTPSAAFMIWADDRGTEGGGNNPDAWTDSVALSDDFLVLPSPASQEVCSGTNALIDIDVPSFNAFTNPVTLSVMGQPGGTTTNFSVNPVTPPGSSVLTVGNTAAVASGTYNLTITGTAGAITHDGAADLVFFAAAPAAPTLVSPAQGATNVPVDVTFMWNAAADASEYLLEVATDSGFSSLVFSGTTSGTSLAATPDLPSSSLLFWRVTASNGCGSGPTSATRNFTTEALPGDCGPGSVANTLYEYGFESGAGGWTVSGSGGSMWVLSGTKPHTGSTSYFANDIASVSDQQLVSPAFALPTGQNPLTFQFWNDQEIEDSGTGCFDGGILEISTNGGGTWTQLQDPVLETDPYDGVVSSSFGNPLAGLNAWCGDPQPYLNSVVNLDAYAGMNVQLRIRFGTDNSVSHPGWYVDDVLVQSCIADTMPFLDGFESGDTSAWTLTVP